MQTSSDARQTSDPYGLFAEVIRHLTLHGVTKEQIRDFVNHLVQNPKSSLDFLYKLVGIGPTPRFKAPEIPHSQPVGDVCITLRANIAWRPNYNMVLYKNGAPTVIIPTVWNAAGTPVPNDKIPIETSDTNYTVKSSSFTGPGDYLFHVTANNPDPNWPPGYGNPSVEINLT